MVNSGCNWFFIKIFQNPQRELIFWDQDILNIYFDGKYKELETSLNFNVYGDQQKKDSDTELIEKKQQLSITVGNTNHGHLKEFFHLNLSSILRFIVHYLKKNIIL